MESIWWNNKIQRPRFEELKNDIKTDVLIIGGGITGILCAYMLKSAGVDCVVAEADRVCSGITKNTTAKITYQHGLIYDKMIGRFGVEKAQLYLEAHSVALEQYRNISEKVECDFEECDSFVYSLAHKDKIEKEVTALNKIGCSATFVDSLQLPFAVAGAVKVKNQAQFNPLKFVFSIAKDLPIYERTKVLEITPDVVKTAYGKIKAKKIIVATHFPFINKHGGYFLKMYQHRSYAIAFKNAPIIKGIYVDESKKGLSFRNYGDLLILGGGSHRTGKKGGNWQELLEFAKLNYPTSQEVCRWATQDCMTLDDIPYIGQYSKETPDFYVATGFNKWGMTSAMTSAMILTDLVQGKENKYSSVFSPSRSSMRPQLAINTAEALIGILTPTVPRCPHLGCALKFNRQERTWDCSCHGSRFTEDGELIDNPASGDKKK
ncbi:MAG: FAD-dependent oxidoreductase [Clostridia bacterium]|nr:FAD-dependent oxidoreductase [Clostridia bacterium]